MSKRLKQDGGPRAYWAGAVASFGIPFGVYVAFLCPTIAAGDSAELVTAARILGVPHPPGYPLFTLIGHVFTYLPFNSVAWRVNLASALFAALAALLVYLSLHRLTRQTWAALAGALGLAFSRYFWHYAEVTEVFALNGFFAALLTYLLVLLTQEANRQRGGAQTFAPSRLRHFYLLSFGFGLGLSNHHTLVLILPAAVWLLWRKSPELLSQRRVLAWGVGFVLLGLTPYLYCPLAALADPAINWDDPVTLGQFFRLLTRADYGGFAPGSAEVVSRFEQLPTFLESLYHQFTPVGVLLAVLGLTNWRRYASFQTYLALAFLLTGVFFVLYANVNIHNPLLLGVLHRFYILPAVFFAFWIGLGVERVFTWLQARVRTRLRLPAGGLLVALLVGWEFVSNQSEADFRRNYVAEDFAYNLLLSLPKNALFFVRGDVASMGVDYLQIVEGLRPDVKTLNQAKLTYPWYYAQAKRRFPDVRLPGERYDGARVRNRMLIEQNLSRFPVFFMDFKEESYQEAFRALPHGLVYKLQRKTAPYSVPELERTTLRLFERFRRRSPNRVFPPTTFEYELIQIYAEPFFRLGYEFEQIGAYRKAESYYRKALARNPVNYKVMKNLAVLYFYKMNRKREAVALFERYLKMNPLDAEAASIRQVIRSVRSGH